MKNVEFSIDDFRVNGLCIVRGVFSKGEIADLVAACDELEQLASSFTSDTFEGATYFALHRDCNPFQEDKEQFAAHQGVLRRVTYPYALSKILNRLRVQKNLLANVAQLLGPNLNQIVNQVNFNPPGLGTGWGWHQDYRFRKPGIPDMRRNYLQSLVAIDLCSTATGGVRLIPKSDHLSLQLEIDQENAEGQFDSSTAIVPELRPGDMVLFNPYVIHGSTANTSEFRRRVFINGYANSDSCSNGMPVLRQGTILEQIKGKMEYEGNEDILPNASKY